MKIGRPAWFIVGTSLASAFGSARKADWLMVSIFGVIAAAFAVASVIAGGKK